MNVMQKEILLIKINQEEDLLIGGFEIAYMKINDITSKCLAHQNVSSYKFSPWQSPLTRFGVDPDFDRFEKIIKGRAREELKRFISPDKMNIIQGGKVVQLPKPRIDMPHFTRGSS